MINIAQIIVKLWWIPIIVGDVWKCAIIMPPFPPICILIVILMIKWCKNTPFLMIVVVDRDDALKIHDNNTPLPPIWKLSGIWCPFWCKNSHFWCVITHPFPPYMSDRVKMMQIHHKIKLIKIHKIIAPKNPLFPPQLSDVCKKHPKNPPVIPYNCQICGKYGVLLILIADTFDENIAAYKAPHSLPNCQKHTKYTILCP